MIGYLWRAVAPGPMFWIILIVAIVLICWFWSSIKSGYKSFTSAVASEGEGGTNESNTLTQLLTALASASTVRGGRSRNTPAVRSTTASNSSSVRVINHRRDPVHRSLMKFAQDRGYQYIPPTTMIVPEGYPLDEPVVTSYEMQPIPPSPLLSPEETPPSPQTLPTQTQPQRQLQPPSPTPTALVPIVECPMSPSIKYNPDSPRSPGASPIPDVYTRESKGEKICRRALVDYFGVPFPRERPAFLNNPLTGCNLELDCYNKELGIACEYSGEQHYKWPNFTKQSYEEFEKQVARDIYKVEQCDNNGVYLITVPYTVPFHKIPDFIHYYLPHNVEARMKLAADETILTV